MNDLVVERLSWPGEDADSLVAASDLLHSRDPHQEIDRLYPRLLHHKTLLTALAHLERAGGNLAELTLSAGVYHSAWPLNTLIPAPSESAGRIPLGSIRDRLRRHKQLLGELAGELVDVGGPGVPLLLHGRALDLAYPEYRHRLDHDVDVLAPDAETGLRLLEALWGGMGFVLLRHRISRVARGWLGYFKMLRVNEEGHQLHADLIVRGRPTGPGMLPPWVLPSMSFRARAIEWGGRTVGVPAPEDMLLALAEKVRRKGELTLRDVSDARYLLRAEQAAMDWEYLVEGAKRTLSGGLLHRLIVEAERREGRRLSPSDRLPHIAPGRLERWFERGLAGEGRRPMGWSAFWAGMYARNRLSEPKAILDLVGDLARTHLARVELGVARAGVARGIRRLNPQGNRILRLAVIPRDAGRDRSAQHDVLETDPRDERRTASRSNPRLSRLRKRQRAAP